MKIFLSLLLFITIGAEKATLHNHIIRYMPCQDAGYAALCGYDQREACTSIQTS
jgi:hypothetical protein